MSSFTFNTGIPAANNNPSVDQPDMLTNNISTNGILAVDHISFNALGGGQHKQITFNGNNPPSTPTDPSSILFTNPGTASSNAQLFWQNASAIFHMSPIRAWGFIQDASGIPAQSYNVAGVTKTGTGAFVVTLATGATSSANYAVIVSTTMANTFSVGAIVGYTILSTTQFQINQRSLTGNSGANTPSTSFMVLQI